MPFGSVFSGLGKVDNPNNTLAMRKTEYVNYADQFVGFSWDYLLQQLIETVGFWTKKITKANDEKSHKEARIKKFFDWDDYFTNTFHAKSVTPLPPPLSL